MKKSISILVILFLSMIILSGAVFATNNVMQENEVGTEAEEFKEQTQGKLENGIIPISEQINENFEMQYIEDDVYLMQDTILVEESVNGNVYLVGDNINISSSIIRGNVVVFGNNVKIDADVSGSLYIVADEVMITGGADDAYIVADNVKFEENSYISRNARVFADTLNLRGIIERDLYSMCKNTNIYDTKFSGVVGKLYYSYNLNVQNNAKIGEKIKIENDAKDALMIEEKANKVIDVIFKTLGTLIEVTQIFTAIIVIVLIVSLTRKKENKDIKENYILEILKGFGFLVVIPIIAVIFMITIIGVPISLILLFIYILALMMSIPVASIKFSRIILREKTLSKGMQILVAIGIYIVLEIIRFIPILGGIIRFIFILYGLNLIIGFPFRELNKKEKKDEIVVVTPEE